MLPANDTNIARTIVRDSAARPRSSSENLEYIVDGGVRLTPPDADAYDAVHPVVFGRGRFEDQAGAQVIFVRSHLLTVGNAPHHLDRPVPHATVDNQQGLAIIQLEHEPHVRPQGTVASTEK